MNRRFFTCSACGSAILLSLVLALAIGPRFVKATPSAQQELAQVWQRVQQSGAYRFGADVTQTLTPQSTPGNAGRDRQITALYLEGQNDLAAESLQLSLWSTGGSVMVPESGMQIKVEGGQAYVRQGGGAWQESDDITGSFAPGGDFLAYVRAADNVERHPPQMRHTVGGDRLVTRYTFDVNGRRVAEEVRAQLQQQAARAGLPPGVAVALPRAYAEMSGQGELWVGADGLPLRQEFDLHFPVRPDNYLPTAHATVDFFDFAPRPAATFSGRATYIASSIARMATSVRSLLYTLTILLALLLTVALIAHRRSRRVYATVALSVLLSMIATPLLRSDRLQAFSIQQVERQRTEEAATAERANEAALVEELAKPSIDPHVDLLKKAQAQSVLADPDDKYYDDRCESEPDGDVDGDGLTNLQECLLGTLLDVADTDGDLLDDGIEVAGVLLTDGDGINRTWYTDPLNQDSNRDGIGDGREWLLDADGDDQPDDSDGDGVPDIWDRDNDGDGVPDNLDLSPYATTQKSATFSGSNPFELVVDDLESGLLTKVEFQLSPAEANHLWYTQNVLDWPDDDRQGTIQDADGATFFDVDPSLSAAPNDNGDMRLIPMLEIEIAGSPDNLPSQTILSQFGISVQQTAQETQTVYVPLQLVTDGTGNRHVAFYGAMYYRAAADWGAAQPVRLVWLVQALVDQCESYNSNVCDSYSSYNNLEVIQSYDDEWYLTGLHVTEEHSAAMDIIYEDPTATAALDAGYDKPFYIDTLYGLLYGLDNTFLAGSDCDSLDGNGACVGDGQRDIDTTEIERRFDQSTNSGVSDEERWNLPNVLDVERRSYESIDLALMDTTITQTVRVLDDAFTSAWSTNEPITPTLMYAYEQTYRSLNLDETAAGNSNLRFSGNQLTVDLPTSGANAVDVKTMNSVKWAPYTYDTATGWNAADLQHFYDALSAQLGPSFADVADPQEADTYQTMSQLLYVSVYTGENSIVQSGNTILSADYEQADQSLAVTLVSDVSDEMLKVVSTYYTYSPQLAEITESIEAGGGEATTTEVLSEFLYQETYKYFTTLKGAGQLAFVTVVALVYAAALFAEYVLHDTSAGWTDAANISTLIFTTIFSIYKPIQKVVALATELAEISEDDTIATALIETLTSSSDVISSSGPAGMIGLIIAAAIAVGIFLYLVGSGKVHAGTIAFNVLVATTIATIIVAVLFYVLANTVIGSILVGLIAIIDILLMLLGVGWSITGWLTTAIAGVIYQFNLLEDIDVEAGDLDMKLTEPDAGLIAGNQMAYAVPITTTLKSDTSYDKLTSNSLTYELSRNAAKLSTKLGDRTDDWTVGAASQLMATVVDRPSLTATLTAGVNVPTPLVLNSAYALRGQSCWVGFCTSKTVKGSSSDNLGAAIVLDVLPDTLEGLVDVTNWGNGLVRFADADGDGLLPFDLGGVDPDPGAWDADGDSLSDAYELTIRSQPSSEGGVDLDPLQADTDGDTIADDVELRNGTNPGNADTDGDGLRDVAELAPAGGWLLAYAPDKLTRVWSDPLQADGDGDGMSDLFERSQDTCPDCAPWADPDNPRVYSPKVWNENPVALYVDNDSTNNIVQPGATILYTTTTINNLSTGQSLSGTVALDLPDGFSGAPLAATVNVTSGERESLVSQVTVNTGQSGVYPITSQMHLTDFDGTMWRWDPPQTSAKNVLHGNAAGPAVARTSGWTEPYLLVMRESGTLTGYTASADGTVHLAHTIFNATGQTFTVPAVACADNNACLVVWGEAYSNNTGAISSLRLHGGFNNPSGNFIWAAANTRVVAPTIASDGTHFMVAWAETSNGQTQLWVQAVNNNGALSGDPQPLAGPGANLSGATLTWTGENFVGVWRAGANLYRADISTAAQVSGVTDLGAGAGWMNTDGTETAPRLAFDAISQQALLLYHADGSGSGELHARRLSTATASAPLVLATDASLSAAGVVTALCADPQNGGWVTAWSLPGEETIRYQAVGPDGSLRGDAESTSSANGAGVALACERPQPILDLEFEESAGATTFADSSGSGHDVSCQGNACPLAGVSGRFGNGVEFDGVDDVLVASLSQPEGAFTTGLWFKTIQQSTTMLHRQNNTKRIYLDNGNLCGAVQIVVSSNTQTDAICTSNTDYADGNWHHAVHTAEDGVHRLYVDGELAATSQKQSFASCSSSCDAFTLGQESTYFQGTLDAVRFYARALSGSEVADAFSGAVAIYDLDEVAGSTTFVNTTNNGYDATCTGSSCPTMGVPGAAYTAAQFDGTDDFLTVDPAKQELARFQYDFESGVDPAWSTTNRDQATRGGAATYFLGAIGKNKTTLDLNNLPTHDTVEITFDLYVLGEWGGNATILGADNWEWGYDNTKVLHTNFSTLGAGASGFYQFYPAESWNFSGITLYGNKDCTNKATTITANTPNLNSTEVGNNNVSCHTIPSNTVAFLYQHENYGGNRWIQDPKRGVAESYPNDEIDSVQVWAAANTPGHGATDSLGYKGMFNQFVYRITHTISGHTASSLQLYFEGLTSRGQAVWGLDNVIVSVKNEGGSLPLTNESFTLAGWAKRAQSGEAHMMLSQGTGAVNQGLQLGFRADDRFTCGFWGNALNTAAAYSDTAWHHWACTYDKETGLRTLYRDGVQVAQNTASASYAGIGATYIGQRFDGQWRFRGTLDEIGIWTEALSAAEIAELAAKIKVADLSVMTGLLSAANSGGSVGLAALTLRETATNLGITSQTISRTITVDAEPPTVVIKSPVADQYVRGSGLLSISGQATDVTTSVEQVEVRVGGGNWEVAAGTESWSYLLDPSALTEGPITLAVRATDAAGNTSAATTSQFILDRTAPTVSVSDTQLWSYRDNQGRWHVPLIGTSSDPAAGSQPGSGATAVEALLDGGPGLAGNGWQRDDLSDTNNWYVDYVLPKFDEAGQSIPDPSGVYTLSMRAFDTVGNRTPAGDYPTAAITVDAAGPVIALDEPISTTQRISTALTLRGRATDATAITAVEINFTPAEQIAALGGTSLHLPLNEPSASQYFADQSGANHAAVCAETSCPQSGAAGVRGAAVQFNGSTQLTVEGVDLAGSSFTLATWAKRTGAGSSDVLYRQGTSGANSDLIFGFLASNQFRCGFGGDALDTVQTYSDTAWHHWACTYDAASGLRTLYQDGAQVAQDTPGAAYGGTGDFLLGSNFTGLLDEATIHDRALAAYEIANLRAYGQVVWASATLSGETNPMWSYTMPTGEDGLEGFYQINVRGTDLLGNRTSLGQQRVWRGEIDTRPPQLDFFYHVDESGSVATTRYECVTSDLNLDQDAACLAVAPATVPEFRNGDQTLTTYDKVDPWYAAAITDTTRLYNINAMRVYSGTTATDVSLRTCDRYGHCTTAQAQPEAAPPPPAAQGAEIVIPSSGTALTSLDPVVVTGDAHHFDGLADLYVHVDGNAVFQTTWPTLTVTSSGWRFTWTPPQQGIYRFQPLLSESPESTTRNGTSTAVAPPADVAAESDVGEERSDATALPEDELAVRLYMPYAAVDNPDNGDSFAIYMPLVQREPQSQVVVSGTVTTLYVDLGPPTVNIDPLQLSAQAALGERIVELSGSASDGVLLHRVDVRVDGGAWQRAALAADGSWRRPLRLQHAADGETHVVSARAEDVAGRTATVTETLYVDMVAPTPGAVTLSYIDSAGQQRPLEPGTPISDATSLALSWGTATDGGGDVTYAVGFSSSLIPDPADLTMHDDADTHRQAVAAGQRWYAHVRYVDPLGNSTTITLGPIDVR